MKFEKLDGGIISIRQKKNRKGAILLIKSDSKSTERDAATDPFEEILRGFRIRKEIIDVVDFRRSSVRSNSDTVKKLLQSDFSTFLMDSDGMISSKTVQRMEDLDGMVLRAHRVRPEPYSRDFLKMVKKNLGKTALSALVDSRGWILDEINYYERRWMAGDIFLDQYMVDVQKELRKTLLSFDRSFYHTAFRRSTEEAGYPQETDEQYQFINS